MGKLTSGVVLLVLAIPLALYAAWQVNGLARADMIASDSPADQGPPKEQLARSRENAVKWSIETRKAVTVAWKYGAATPDDTSPNATVTEVVKASAARSADLTDLDLFLSGVEGQPFTGKLRATYIKWKDDADLARKDEQAVKDWFAKSPTITSAADANKAMDAMIALIRQYNDRSKFVDRVKGENWRVRARLSVIESLAGLAETQYNTAAKMKLPLGTDKPEVKAAIESLRGVNTQIDLLKKDLENATRDKLEIDASLLEAAGVKLKVLAQQNSANLGLLELFAREDLFTNPNGAVAWLQQVGAKYDETKDRTAADLIRNKAQEFCEAFIPAAVRLDDHVLIRGKPALRKSVKVQYIENGERKDADLTDNPDGLNEFNFHERYPGGTTFVGYAGAQEFPKDMTPTDLSKAAVLFHGARSQVSGGPNAPRWTAKSVEELKKKCEAQKDLVDQLQPLVGGTAGKTPKLWTRLSGLADGIKNAPDLFAVKP